MKVVVEISRRAEIADPQGATIGRALHDLGYREVVEVRVDRTISLELEGLDRQEAVRRVTEMCELLLANPVLEDFRVVGEG